MNRPFNKVGVLLGGPSAEREVSLKSGAAVVRGLQSAGYDAVGIDVTTTEIDLPSEIEAVFIALHGTFGEDGTLQAVLEERGRPYTGSGPDASRIAFDKKLSKEVFVAQNVPTPEFEVLVKGQERKMDLPLAIKPLRQGSSIGAHIVFDEAQWDEAYADALSYDGEVLVERYIKGAELTVGVLDGEALPIVEIRAPQGNYDYAAKYTKGVTEYLVPAPLSDAMTATCQTFALQAYRALGCCGFGRVDFLLDADGNFYCLEMNTIPGFTETSLLPKAAAAAGITFPDLCDRIMRLAASR